MEKRAEYLEIVRTAGMHALIVDDDIPGFLYDCLSTFLLHVY